MQIDREDVRLCLKTAMKMVRQERVARHNPTQLEIVAHHLLSQMYPDTREEPVMGEDPRMTAIYREIIRIVEENLNNG
jgi:hypothetical protein